MLEYSSAYLLFISYSTICFWIDWVHVYEDAKIEGPRFKRNCIIAKEQKSDEHGASFQSLPKINRMLITRLIFI